MPRARLLPARRGLNNISSRVEVKTHPDPQGRTPSSDRAPAVPTSLCAQRHCRQGEAQDRNEEQRWAS